MTGALLRIGELAAHARVSIRTVDYYTGLGLLSPAQRTAGGYRLYERSDVDKIDLVRRLEVQGVPLEEIATALRTGQVDVAPILERIDEDLRALQAAADAASPELHGLLAAIATRAHSLLALALQIPPAT
ncbi:MerR family transcriptional regulator [Saccharothrix sp. Mg75]|uniref:MerR family transcriptional regulator n=1 Tax=Saccharothrix sp. Mg75 TaxID=3445357 RepID=UPI003EECE7F7